MENLISTCYVIESKDYGVEPVIYLNRPETMIGNEVLRMFHNPFEARNYIRSILTESVEITVTREAQSQLLSVLG